VSAEAPPLVVLTSPAPPELFAGFLADARIVPAATSAELMALAGEAEVIIGDWSHRIHLDREVFAAARRCRLVQQPTAGYEHIDVAAAAAAGIPVANAGDANAAAVAEHAVMLAIGVLRHLRQAIAVTEAGAWRQQDFIDLDLPELGPRTVGIVGLGAIGQAAARRFVAFGCDVLYTKRTPLPPDAERELGIRHADLDALLRASEVLVLALPLNDQTRGIIDARRLALLPRGAVVVNIARAGLVDNAALGELLRSGHLAGAGLDVFDEEPLPTGHDLATLPNVLLTPHIAGVTAEAKRRLILNSMQNIRRVLDGGEPEFVVNRPVAARPAPGGGAAGVGAAAGA
jgi:D-3-phosphoglycerate dehydrogenase